jgi:multisubunit Na+/H+ antiporter MnhF subunit
MMPDAPALITALMGLLACGMLLGFVRLAIGPSLADRVVALDVLVMMALGQLVLYAIGTANAVFLDIAIAMALIVFLSTVAFARYLEKRITR